MTHPALAFSVRTPPEQRASCLIQSLLQTDLQEQQRLLRSKLLIVISLISRVVTELTEPNLARKPQQAQSWSVLLSVLVMLMHPGYLLTAWCMFESINTPLCEGLWCVCVLHACALKTEECIVSWQSHMWSQRVIVVTQRCDADLFNLSRVSAVLWPVSSKSGFVHFEVSGRSRAVLRWPGSHSEQL